MWQKLSIFILRYRLFFLLGLLGTTAFMGWHALQVQMTYDFAQIVPKDHPTYQDFQFSQDHFGEDGNIMVIGVESPRLFDVDFFNDWQNLGNQIREIEGINGVLSIAHAVDVTKDTASRSFKIVPLTSGPFRNQQEVDTFKNTLQNLPFYHGLIFNPSTRATIMAVTFDEEYLDSKDRIGMVESIKDLAEGFQQSHDVELHFSGLPFIRSYNVTTISKELQQFLLFAMIILAVILLLLFRTIYAVIFPLLVVVIGAIWSIGSLVLFGYKITLLTGLIPTLIVVIGIPNCVYMLNKYHTEFRKHGNKQKALLRTIEKIGHVTFFTNLTTAIGFGVFYFTDVKLLTEFGIVAFLNIVATFAISVVAIPVVFSYLPAPKLRHTIHLQNRVVNIMLNSFQNWTKNYRTRIYAISGVLFLTMVVGIFFLDARGYILDDVPQESKIYKDLKFFEQNFQGIMPFEVLIDTREQGGVNDPRFAQKLGAATDTLQSYSIFSKPLSVVTGLKFVNQAYRDGNPGAYRLPTQFELTQDPVLRSYLKRTDVDTALALNNGFTDAQQQVARINAQIADIGSDSLEKFVPVLKAQLEQIFPPEEYTVIITGTSVISTAGFNFLIDGLIWSVALAFLLIACIIAYLFRSLRMLFLALIPNVIPLVVTAGIMGYFDIPLKPSTVLIFSVAFGISVDYTIHFLAKYRQELFRHSWDISKTVEVSLQETGVSMIYTSLILFAGFVIFTGSSFEGTVNLGRLTSITLIVAMLSNLVILPALLISFERIVNRKAIKNEPLLDVYDEEEDIEMDKLDFKQHDS